MPKYEVHKSLEVIFTVEAVNEEEAEDMTGEESLNEVIVKHENTISIKEL